MIVSSTTWYLTLFVLLNGVWSPSTEEGWSARAQPSKEVCQERAKIAGKVTSAPGLVWMCLPVRATASK